ncbi:pre-rrna-processing protein tsr1 homolog [Stylonychia lemnae]|uniref:Pre-rrna-processing protein tsr1 homolog n=1 Tax=Stylonychia lemnae TaxID=5949 RepID=A0A077ZWW0_STYLE|nr:pre-rrna-processing protein tsr1 homolog [Stylonychia lemnae]|eukprot:CDW72986.1 pre-rrna-processing protein tsr1 homolog [Stylonychia lemnae]
MGSSNGVVIGKAQRFNMENEARKIKREDMIMKRRGLNFVSDQVAESLDDQSVAVLEQEVDNVAPKVVAILGLNSACDVAGMRIEMVKHCIEYQKSLIKGKHESLQKQQDELDQLDSQFKAYVCPNPGSSTNLGSKKQRLIFLEINREDDEAVLQVGKIADLILVVMSCAESDIKGVKIDPDRFSNAIDETGYKALGLLRSQGLPALVGVLQHLEKHKSNKQPQLKKLFQRYFESEFTNQHKFLNFNLATADTDVNALLRQIAVLYPNEITWRHNRSYMLGHITKIQSNEVHVEGYIKQNFLNAKRLLHITGVNNQLAFKIKRIEIAKDPCPMKISNKEKEKIMSTSKAQSIIQSKKNSRKGSMDDISGSVSQNGDNVNKVIQQINPSERDPYQIENNPGLFCAEQTWPTEEELKTAKQAKKSRRKSGGDDEMQTEDTLVSSYPVSQSKAGASLEEMFERIKIVGKQGEDNKSDDAGSMHADDEDEDDDELDETMFREDNKISMKHQKLTDLEGRARDDMDFPDEVDTPLDVEARNRFIKYRGIKSIKNCDWDPYENLPPSYSKIWRFQSYQQAYKDSVQQVIEEGLPLNGTYLRIVIEVEEKTLLSNTSILGEGKAIIMSTLFPHECKLSVMHFKIQRHFEHTEPVESKTEVEIHCGFRKMTIRPVYSSETSPGGLGASSNEKLKYQRFLRHDMSVIASTFCPIVFAPCKVLMFTKNNETGSLSTLATGNALPPNPLAVILKRIILTGYPLKVHKKKAVIRYMFFNPKDVKYFKPVELYTKFGLRGHIKDSLGTHGLLKAQFNDFMKQNDTVCMPLYKRQYPVWFEKTWTGEEPKDEEGDQEMN